MPIRWFQVRFTFEIDNIDENTISFWATLCPCSALKNQTFFKEQKKTVFIYNFANQQLEGKKTKCFQANECKISLNAALLSILLYCSNRHHHTICAFKSIFAQKHMNRRLKRGKMRKRRILYSFARKWTVFKCLVTTFGGFFLYMNREKMPNNFAYA